MSYYYRSAMHRSISNGLSRSRYFRSRTRVRSGYNTPWYSIRRLRPGVEDIDQMFRKLREDRVRETERMAREVDESDSEDDDSVDVEHDEITASDVDEKLHVTDVDFQLDENVSMHHTDMYECTEKRNGKDEEAVVRRGQDFIMTINFDRPCDLMINDVTLIFTLAGGDGSRSNVQEVVKVNEADSEKTYVPRNWGARVLQKKSTFLTVEVFCPASTAVGTWELTVKTVVDVDNDGKDLIWQYHHNEDIKILFNPWCKEDVVYIPDEDWLEEAVLNDSGVLYFGTHQQIGVSSWYLGQFEDGILEASLHLLRRAFNFKATKAMGNAVRVTRALSQIVNSNDDNGVLVGNWTDDTSGGIKPTAWTGSVKILKQYMKTKKPVKYAQCWVYSGVLTTVCRALGIPCRSVTNFESAHNADKEYLSYDIVFKPNAAGELARDSSVADSVWNFHLWNEVWMSRPDLGGQYDGWQAIDATPQERSDGVFCCGPAPVKAIKEGQISIGHDTPFVFAEVNADKVVWVKTPEGLKLVSRDTHAIGKHISTHQPTGVAINGLQRLDLTDNYKYENGSEKERKVVLMAEKLFRQDNLEPDDLQPEEEPVEVQIEDLGDIYVGNGFTVTVTVNNKSDETRNVNLSIIVKYKMYTGNTTGTCSKKKYKDEMFKSGESRSYTLLVTDKEALQRPREGFNFHIEATAEVKETGNIATKLSSFRLRRPDLHIEGPNTGEFGATVHAEMSFTNPLSVLMTNTEINIDGNLKPAESRIVVGSIRPGVTWKKTIKMTPSRRPLKKERDASFTLESDQLGGIVGNYAIKLS